MRAFLRSRGPFGEPWGLSARLAASARTEDARPVPKGFWALRSRTGRWTEWDALSIRGMAATRVLLRESWAGSRDRGKGNNCRTGGSARFPLRRPFRFVPGSPAASQQGARVPAMRERLSGVPPEGVPGLRGACGGEARFEDGIPLRTFPGWRSLGVLSVNRNSYFFRRFRIGRRERQ